MSLNSAALKMLVDKGLSAEDILEFAYALEGGRPKQRIDTAAENDRTPRLSSEQRRARYAALTERGGPICSDCGCGEETIWRRMGVNGGPGEQYTRVHPTTNLEVDHRTPLWAGGDNALSNLWLLCIDCHKRKTAAEAGQRRRA